MKFIELHLENVKHLRDVTVSFSEGITILEGPNGAGKSTLMEAFEALRTAKDSSSSAVVGRLGTLGSDTLPLVRARVEIAGAEWTYEKCFGKKRDGAHTTLENHATGEQTTGDEAHDTFSALFDEHCDVELWDIMRIQEGAPVEANWREVPSLGEALDTLASSPETAGDDTLIAQATDWATRWRTPTGKLNADAKALIARRDERADDLRAVLDQQAQHEQALEQLAHLRLRIAELATTRSDLDERIATASRHEHAARTHAVAAEAAAARRAEHEATLSRMESAAKELTNTARDLKEVRHELQELEDTRTRLATALEAARTAEAQTREDAQRAHDAVVELRALHTRAKAHEASTRAAVRIDEARHELESLEKLFSARDAAKATLAANRVTASVLADIRRAQAGVEAATDARRHAAGHIAITAAADIEIVRDDVTEQVAAGHEATFPLDVETVLRGSHGDIRLTPPAGIDAQRHEADEALARTLSAAGASSVADAETKAAARLQSQLAHERVTGEINGRTETDATRLREEIATLEVAQTDAQTDTQAQPDPRNAEELAEALQSAEGVASAMKQDSVAADNKAQGLQAQASDVDGRIESLKVRRDRLRTQLDQIVARNAPGADPRADHAEVVEHLAAEVASLQDKIATTAPLETDVSVDSAGEPHESVTHLRDVLQSVHDELHECAANKGRLEAMVTASDGIEGRVVAAQSALDIAEREVAAMEAQVRASTRLLDALTRARAAQARAHARPFADELQRLGRILFGDAFAVELNEDLRVTQATIAGQTLSAPDPSAREASDKMLGQLSRGQVEQLTVLQRLAVASLLAADDVAGSTPMPVWLDDVLVYSDPLRMQRMQEVLTDVSRRTQVVLLTANASRASELPDARRVQVGSAVGLMQFNDLASSTDPADAPPAPARRRKRAPSDATAMPELLLDLDDPAQTGAKHDG